MNNATITPMPALCNPEKLNAKELVAHINYLQDAVLQQGQAMHDTSIQLGEMCGIAKTLASHLYALVDAFDEGDQKAIAVQLTMLSERRKSFKKPGVH